MCCNVLPPEVEMGPGGYSITLPGEDAFWCPPVALEGPPSPPWVWGLRKGRGRGTAVAKGLRLTGMRRLWEPHPPRPLGRLVNYWKVLGKHKGLERLHVLLLRPVWELAFLRHWGSSRSLWNKKQFFAVVVQASQDLSQETDRRFQGILIRCILSPERS